MASGMQFIQALLAKSSVSALPVPSKKVVIVDAKASLIEGFEVRFSTPCVLFFGPSYGTKGLSLTYLSVF